MKGWTEAVLERIYIYIYETKSSRMFEYQQNDDEIWKRDR